MSRIRLKSKPLFALVGEGGGDIPPVAMPKRHLRSLFNEIN